MRILLLGSGGREHAIARKISDSVLCKKLFIAPGNAGTHHCGENIDISLADHPSLARFCVDQKIDMVVVGPEVPLAAGIQDFFAENKSTSGVLFVGPSKAGALLESSKKFAKEFMQRNNIPTARYQSFSSDEFEQAVAFLDTLKPPYVLKADGLAAGKGVLISETRQQAENDLHSLLTEGLLGKSSEKVVIEEFLDGIEVSVFVATDGNDWILLPEAKDYKRIGENDTGPNTGGMGAVSPVPFADAAFMEKVKSRIIQPTIDGIRKENIDYKGFIFFGLMNVDSNPYVIEYNVRLGDPEAEVILPRINTDFVTLLSAIAKSELKDFSIEICPDFGVTIMLVSGGYPGSYEKGKEITGLANVENSQLFFAGASMDGDRVVTSGGRVISVTSLHPSFEKARNKALSDAQKVHFVNKFYRKDIGLDLT